MNEIKLTFSDAEIVAELRKLGAVVEERSVTKWIREESYQVWIWQVQKVDGNWIDAIPVFRELVIMGLCRGVFNKLSKQDLLDIIK